MRRLRFVLPALAFGAILAGALQLSAAPAFAAKTSNCPSSTGCGCSTAYAPVACGHGKCRYTNFCHARCAGWTSADCTELRP
jgi:hypothetical protein